VITPPIEDDTAVLRCSEGYSHTERFLHDRDLALSGEDRSLSLLAQDQYFQLLHWIALDPLSEEEEAQDLACLVHGDRDQASTGANPFLELFHAYLPLVSRMALKLWYRTGCKADLMDLIQMGNMALLTALNENTHVGTRGEWITYLTAHVRGALHDAIFAEKIISIPRSSMRDAKKQGQEQDLLRLCHPVRLEHTNDDGKEASLLDILEAPALILSPPPQCPPEKVHALALLLAELPAPEREVLRLRYGLHEDGLAYSQAETAILLRLSEPVVKQKECHALLRLQNLIATYEQETGRTQTRWLDANEDLATYLEQRRVEKAALPRATRAVNAQVYQAYTAMQEAGEVINSATLAARANVSHCTAWKYLLTTKGYIPLSTSQQQTQSQLEQAYATLREAGASISSYTLARQANVSQYAACKYLSTLEGYLAKDVRQKETLARLEQAYTTMQEAGEGLNSATLAKRAGVSKSRAWTYLKTREQGEQS